VTLLLITKIKLDSEPQTMTEETAEAADWLIKSVKNVVDDTVNIVGDIAKENLDYVKDILEQIAEDKHENLPYEVL
jgi:rRNA processing protein Krr1/Pno1